MSVGDRPRKLACPSWCGPAATALTCSSGRAEELSTKPKTASLLSGMSPEDVTLDEALRLLTLPRNLGRGEARGEEVVADNGRYGPYVRRGTDYRSLENEDQLFTVTLDEALDLFSKPRSRRARQAAHRRWPSSARIP